MERIMKRFLFLLLLWGTSAVHAQNNVPAWSKSVVWYQIFPERFRDGDPNNQPVRASLEFSESVPEGWKPSAWTQDWYRLDGWEQKLKGFYEQSSYMRRYGGDLQGVLDELPYLHSLGITGLYFNPIFYARSMHKYDASSYHHIDPYFGPDPAGDLALIETETADPKTWKWTAADRLFLKLVSEAHQRGMRIIIDGVFNHSGRDFFAFQNLARLQERSPYKSWYIVQSYDNPATPQNEFKYKGWWDIETLPVFADTPDGQNMHPEVVAYVKDITRRWMDPNGDGNPTDGIDGWRLDVANEVPLGFWKEWNAHVRSINPQAYTVTEIWDNAQQFVEQGGFSASMNYNGFSIPVHDFFVDGRETARGFLKRLLKIMTPYRNDVPFAMQNLTDSHDTDRLASMTMNADQALYDRENSTRLKATYNNDKPDAKARQLQKMIEIFRFTMLGAPMIYYGTESGMWGGDDPDSRKPMVWPDLKYEDEAVDAAGRPHTPNPVAFDTQLFGFYQAVIAVRNQHPVFSNGQFCMLYAHNPSQTLAFGRRNKDEQAITFINRGMAPRTITILAAGRDQVRVPIIATSGELIPASLQHGKLTVHMPPQSAAVYILR